ncbi:MAG: UDP-N-acetylenolpyruvoylglucosamine reductase [Nitrospirae bacterium GWD2_57_9]|nr:MAG: UDP-N-acetylenolpyruvoylglucosamine reductase [Nitrospirae bacterium GWD2_57_9]OGW48504.1 MAG: UDP-N-acetylenolpyruvoylglucosamine reductase [Nitrospirae bacterium GWC2_57_9]
METLNSKGELRRNEPLSGHTSFRIGGPADVLAFPVDREDLEALLRQITQQGRKYFILGGGTNLLVRDGGVRGVVVSLQRMGAIRTEREYRSVGGTFSIVAAEAGAPLGKLQSFAAEHGLTGLEFAAGIPGTVGGAICMNAGTAAGEVGDIVQSVTTLGYDGRLIARGREELGFGYRTSNIPEGHFVVEAAFVLRHDDREKIKARVKELQEKRKQRQPMGAPNAGSIFKNPYEESAGKLIETAKLKGRRIGDAQVSDKHANFILNVGNATARDVLELMEIVKQTVLEVHGVRLEPEIKIIGED